MKKLIALTALAVTTLMMASCGGSKQVVAQNIQQADNGLGVEIAKSPAQVYSENPALTTLRGYAKYNGLPSMPLEVLSANNARGQLALSIAAYVQAAVSTYAGQYGVENLSDNEVTTRLTGNTKAGIAIKSFAEELIRFAPVVVSNSYRQANGTVDCHTCVEIKPAEVVKSLRANEKVQDAVNSDEKLQIDFQSEQFEKAAEEGWKLLREAKKEKK